MKKILFVMAMALCIPVFAASNSVSYADIHFVKSATFNWSNMGLATTILTNDTTCIVTSKIISGTIESVVLTAANSSNATIYATLKDADGVDMFMGNNTFGTNNLPYRFFPAVTNGVTSGYRAVAFDSALILTVSRFATTTTTNTGSLKIYYRE